MKTKLVLTCAGETKSEIEAKAKEKIAEYLEIDQYDVDQKCDIELSVEEKSVPHDDTRTFYLATVYVRVK